MIVGTSAVLMQLSAARGCVDGSLAEAPLGLATLGPAGTSSDLVAQSLGRTTGRTGPILLEPSFEAAAEHVAAGSADLLLVAGAYLRLNSFLMDPRLRVLDGFLHNTPDYLVAGADVGALPPPTGGQRPPLFTHPSPLPLLGRMLPDAVARFELIEVASTSVAAARARETGAFAFTNVAAAGAEGLVPLTRPAAITMLWLLFVRSGGAA